MMMKKLNTTFSGKRGHVLLNMSAYQHTAAGDMLFKFYYSGKGTKLLEMAPNSSGYPHNGAEHTLRIWGNAQDVFAWFDLLRETFVAFMTQDLKAWFDEIQSEIDAYKKEHEYATT